jgi:hypothetical protein
MTGYRAGRFAMDKVSIHFEHCYGIKSLKHEFDFRPQKKEDKPRGAFVVYAPNGAMKSSFAQTFRDAQLGQQSSDRIFPDRQTTRSILDEDGKPIDGARILVVQSYDEQFGPTEQTCNLLVNPTLRDEYTKLHIEVDKAKVELLKALKDTSKSKLDIEAEVSVAIMQAPGQFILALRRVSPEVSELETVPWKGLPYDKVFDQKNLEAVSKGGFQEFLKDYVKKYDELLEASTFCKKGVFEYYHASEIARTLAKNGFFKAKHTVHLNHNGTSREIQNEKDLENLIQEERDAILTDADLKKSFNQVTDALEKNAGLRDFRDFLMAHPDVVAQLQNVAQFRQDVWKSYFKECEALYTDLLEKYAASEKRRKEIELQAASEHTQWQEVIDEFNRRFIVPFKLEAQNYAEVVLGGKGIELAFTYDDGIGKAPIKRNDLLSVLSMGERRALYILNVIFEVQTRMKLAQKTLLVVDDIADSFDYQNKYAIIQYLKEISDHGLFRQVILTHNFDFFRTVQSRNIAAYSCCLMAHKTKQGVTLQKADGIQNVFVNDWKKNFFSDDRKKIASIPFLRNLIEFSKGDGEPSYALLTSMLHWKNDTPSLTLAQIDQIYRDVCGGTDSSKDAHRLVIDVIDAEAEECAKQPASMSLSSKVVLAMGIRLRAERFMATKIADTAFFASIDGKQTQAYVTRFRAQFPTEIEAIKVLNRVALMTPENIHLNSFMYEPILDMSAEHLCRLYSDVKALL